MTSPAQRAVLHITSALGGGADRYIRDVASSVRAAHAIWHVGSRIDVVEDIRRPQFWPVSTSVTEVAEVLGATTALAHVHAVDRGSRERLQRLRAARPDLPHVVTLHDVGFLHPDAFGAAGLGAVDRQWIAEVGPVLREAGAVLAPSPYIAGLVTRWFPEAHVSVVAPGLRREPGPELGLPRAFAERSPRQVVAVVGAIGPHKGSALLAEIARDLHALDCAIVVLGYTDDRLTPGWSAPGLFVHGPYEDAALPAWLTAYAPVLALFPNRLPESFSYTLSEVWSAGLPAIVPDEGALGQRVAAHGGGWILPAGFGAKTVVDALAPLLAPEGRAEVARVKLRIVPNDPAQVPTLSHMSAAIEAVYARFGVEATDAGPEALHAAPWQRLLAVNLDGFAFRQELVFLCESLANLELRAAAAADHAEANRQWAERITAELEAAKSWSAKIEGDVAVLNQEIAHRDDIVKELNAGIDWLRGELANANASITDANARIVDANARMADASADIERLVRARDETAPIVHAFGRLPEWVRQLLLKSGT